MARIGIIGGGPGGLMTAELLERRHGDACTVTIFEASERVGGKLHTRAFTREPVSYEAGAAELYDYSAIGDDPLRALVTDLGLDLRPLDGKTVILRDTILRNDAELARRWGEPTLEAVRAFRRRAAELLPMERWHPESWTFDREHPWARRTCEELLHTVADPVARHFLRVAVHSDLATEPHLTSGLNGLKNFVMDVPGYVACRSVDGGMSRLAERLVARIPDVRMELGARVARVEADGHRYRICHVRGGERRVTEVDAVVCALPLSQLAAVELAGEPLRSRVAAHVARFDRPGHYLRVSILFREPFWRDRLEGSWFMLDAFGGTCVYDESARFDAAERGVLGFLLAGSDALRMAKATDEQLVRDVLAALPLPLRRDADRGLMEARVHRWCGGVSGEPGGLPAADPVAAHRPGGERFGGLLLVGDYLFDSTLNGVHRSASLAADLLASRLLATAA